MTLDKKGTFVRKAAGPVALAILFSISLVHGAYAQEGTTVPSSPSSFLTDLTLGSSGPDVQRLQEYLNAHDFPLASAGAGSAGQETTYFGPMTKAALVPSSSISPRRSSFRWGSHTPREISMLLREHS